MPPIPEDIVQRVREAADIVEVVGEYVSLQRAGRNWRGLCPFHAERVPSFTVSPEKQIFHCFGCGAGGNVFSFLMKLKGFSFPEAVRELAARYGVAIPEGSGRTEGQRRVLYEVNELACRFYQQMLRRHPEAQRYLEERGISAETAQRYRLGFAPRGWHGLERHLSSRGVSPQLAHEAGLLGFKEPGRYYDQLRGRIVFPIMDPQGRPVGFGGRALGEEEPKYLNTSDSPIFSKGSNLYGIQVAREVLHRRGALLVEGYFDVLVLHQHGLTQAVATLGTALTAAHLRLLRRYTTELVVVFDGDEAGKRAAVRALPLLLQEGWSPRALFLPAGLDPDAYVRQRGADSLQEALERAPFLMHALLEESCREARGASPERKAAVADQLLSLLGLMPDEVERDLYLRELSERLGVPESSLRMRLRRGARRAAAAEPLAPDRTRPERFLVELLVLYPELARRAEEEAALEELQDGRLKRLAGALLEAWRRGGSPADLLDDLEDEEMRGLLSRALLAEPVLSDPERAFSDCLRQLRLLRLREEAARVDQLLQEAWRRGDEGRVWELVRRRQLISRQRERLASRR